MYTVKMSQTVTQRPWVVIPTYNERQNIGQLIDGLLALPVPNLMILVVDDHSPDSTGEKVQSYKDTDRVHLLDTGARIGFGASYQRGFDYAVEHKASAIIHMDADLSHDPVAVPDLIAGLADADVVIGSRYTNGISIVNWPMIRLFISLGANAYARIVTGLTARDTTSGFRAWRSDALTKTNYQAMKVDGYGFLIAMLFAAHRNGSSIAEVPIVFTERQAGKSKMSKRIMFESFLLVLKLRLNPPARS
ncbi:dolichyl-phosphate beta-D-mannosyltransferase [bacterium]|nr:dolichyl-phosphate beta-D-mannosyltransferase [bacterium]